MYLLSVENKNKTLLCIGFSWISGESWLNLFCLWRLYYDLVDLAKNIMYIPEKAVCYVLKVGNKVPIDIPRIKHSLSCFPRYWLSTIYTIRVASSISQYRLTLASLPPFTKTQYNWPRQGYHQVDTKRYWQQWQHLKLCILYSLIIAWRQILAEG